ncbi:MAG: DegT/DnrJ/EryC1/StrS family aminotransferase [Candidatus Competibacter sp.]|nr:DegT/DnrJ/EryC1/StrS family aminotransferase [Candidatus Competibacter sp.]
MSGHRELIPIARPLLGDEEAQAVSRALQSGWVSQGPEVAAFEREFAERVGAPHACAVSSCTTALHLALLAVGVQAGDEVVTVSHSFIATANAIRYCNAVPVFVDIQPDTYNLDPEKLEAAIGPRTRAVLAVHQLGMPCDLPAILPLAGRYHLPVVEDAACAIGSEIRIADRWEAIGRPHGDIACFSFHPRKVITTGDGGMLTTHNPEYDRRFRLWRQHSMNVPDTVRHGASEVIFESYPELGFNYRMTDIQAAVGRVQLRRLPDIVRRRRKLGQRYQERLAGIPGLGLPIEPEWARTNWQSYCVRLPADRRQQPVMQALLDRGIATRRGVMCAHREAAYPFPTWSCPRRGACGCAPYACQELQHSERAQDQCIILPLYPQMTDDDQDRVILALRQVLDEQE